MPAVSRSVQIARAGPILQNRQARGIDIIDIIA
jgi:hypothetical protein